MKNTLETSGRNTLENFVLGGRTAIVTGATGLIGREHCFALHDAGATVVVADIDLSKAEGFAMELGLSPNAEKGQPAAFAVQLDVRDPNSVQAARDLILKKTGSIDVLVNNAAINDMFENPSMAAELSKFENYPLEMWKKMFDVNVTGMFLCSQIFGAEMAKQNRGSIVNIASTYGMVAPDQSLYVNKQGEQTFYKSPAYPATKGAVNSFTKFLASHWGHAGVRVNTLSPGGVENGQQDWFIENYSARTPLGRMAKPGDYRGALIFLASDLSSYVTGANLVVDGGWTCR